MQNNKIYIYIYIYVIIYTYMPKNRKQQQIRINTENGYTIMLKCTINIMRMPSDD